MIEINLLPGAGKKSRGRGAAGAGFAASLAGATAKIRDPFLIAAVVGVALALGAVAFMYTTQTARADELAEAEQRAQQDSARFAAVIADRRKAEAQRDSVLRQLDVIRSIDDQRYVWPHVMEELSKALPPYTWLTSVAQTSAVPTPAIAAPDSAGQAPDSVESAPPMRFRLVGNTVDIQALTRFIRLLEASAFVQNVQLVRSEPVLVENRQVTEFQLDAEWQKPDSAAIRTVPVSLSVR
jgi:Tfp pilus assembly protein PilN